MEAVLSSEALVNFYQIARRTVLLTVFFRQFSILKIRCSFLIEYSSAMADETSNAYGILVRKPPVKQ
jgi:hypothetical protein